MISAMEQAHLFQRGRPTDMPIPEGLPGNPDNLIVVRLTEEGKKVLYPKYLFYVFVAAWQEGQFERIATGSVYQHIKVNDLKKLSVGSDIMIGHLTDIFVLKQRELQTDDILLQRVSGTGKYLGQPYFVTSISPLKVEDVKCS